MELSWDISWSGLEGNITVAHFHGPAPPGMNAGIQVDWGTISGLVSPSIGSATLDAAQAADLLAGLWYINIHSDLFLSGEIRGQVEEAAPAITGTPSEIAFNFSGCVEQGNPPAVLVPVNPGETTYSCSAEGFSPTPGSIMITVARGPVVCGGGACSNVGMEVTGFSPLSATCMNFNTGQSVTLGPLGGATSVDCSANGLTANQGNTVSIQVRGTAP
jgi:hypothetical protein